MPTSAIPGGAPSENAGLSNVHEYSVSELSGQLKRTIEDAYGHVRVRGELGRVTRAGSGHMYLDLKDERAVLSGVVWKGQAARLKIKPEQGLEVIATGRLTTFPGQSRYQIVIESLEPAGVGALMALLEERRKKLAAEGLFDEDRKRALPFLPQTIGVVTSPTGAVIRDILHRLRDRFPRPVLLWPSLVQGEKAAEQIAAGIAGLNALPEAAEGPEGSSGGPTRPDVIIVARGGGSLEDLWAFNEEIVVRAAAASAVPLISAVGHETDTTLIDFAADRRAPTPTAAAEMAVPVRAELTSAVLDLERRLVGAEARLLERGRTQLSGAARGLGRPEALTAPARQRLDLAASALGAAGAAATQRAGLAFERIAGRLSPLALRSGLARRGDHVAGLSQRLARAAAQSVSGRREALARLALSPKAAADLGARKRRDLSEAARALAQAMARAQEARRAKLKGAGGVLEALGPRGVLARGFALVRDETGGLIRSAEALKPGDAARLQFADGERRVTATPDPASAPREGDGPRPRARAKTPSKPSARQPRLL
ncbi:MAG: exodeoxyribonuclease VII large subunit [Pseudomonadota bacterium]